MYICKFDYRRTEGWETNSDYVSETFFFVGGECRVIGELRIVTKSALYENTDR